MRRTFVAVLAMGWFASAAWAAPAPSSAPSAVETDAYRRLTDPKDMSGAVAHSVARGESLAVIAKRYGITIGLLKKANALSGDALRAGQTLKVPNIPLSVHIDKSDNTLVLKAGETVLKTYRVSTGTNNSTPIGTFKTTDKLVNPTWYFEGKKIPFGSPEHQLGTRWIGIDKKGYGIHGTIEPDKIGQQVTHGCVRLRNEEVEELFDLLPTGAAVTIVD